MHNCILLFDLTIIIHSTNLSKCMHLHRITDLVFQMNESLLKKTIKNDIKYIFNIYCVSWISKCIVFNTGWLSSSISSVNMLQFTVVTFTSYSKCILLLGCHIVPTFTSPTMYMSYTDSFYPVGQLTLVLHLKIVLSNTIQTFNWHYTLPVIFQNRKKKHGYFAHSWGPWSIYHKCTINSYVMVLLVSHRWAALNRIEQNIQLQFISSICSISSDCCRGFHCHIVGLIWPWVNLTQGMQGALAKRERTTLFIPNPHTVVIK